MPCESVTTQSINLANAMPTILGDALVDDRWMLAETTDTLIRAHKGYSSIVWNKGQGLTITGDQNIATIQRITKAYSARAVSWAAQRAGWTVKQSGTPNVLNVTRR